MIDESFMRLSVRSKCAKCIHRWHNFEMSRLRNGGVALLQSQ